MEGYAYASWHASRVKIDSGQLNVQVEREAIHNIVDEILRYEMPIPSDLDRVDAANVFDFIYPHAFYKQDSQSLAKEVVSYLHNHKLVESIRVESDEKFQWKKMFPRCIEQDSYGTLPTESEYIDAPDFHAEKPPSAHEENVATLFETVTRIAHRLYKHKYPSDNQMWPRRVRSFYDKVVGKRRKPDIIFLHDAADISNGRVRLDWHKIALVGEIKYSSKKRLKAKALGAIVDASWFALCSTFGRRYVVGLTLCGSILTMSMVDHGGNISSFDIDIEKHLEKSIQCIIMLILGPDEMLGDDRTIGAFEVARGLTESSVTMHVNNSDYRINSHIFLSPSALGRATSVYVATQDSNPQPNDRGAQIIIKDFWPMPDGPFETDYLHCIHSVLKEKNKAEDFTQALPPSSTFPSPIFDELVKCTDPRTGVNVIDSTCLRRRLGGPMLKYERRAHYRIGFREVAVDLTWFATRREYFSAILATLEAHKFAVEHCRLLHKDVSPNNVFILIDSATPENAILKSASPWAHDKAPRVYQLGDWGLCMPLDGCDLKTSNYKARVPGSGEWDTYRVEQRKNKPHKAFNRSETISMMSTQLLADPYGQILPHEVRHDLESFFWTTLWGLINCQGPFHDIVDWSVNVPTADNEDEEPNTSRTTLCPPSWLTPGPSNYTFHDILQSRLATLGNWEYYRGFIQQFWHDEAILNGLREMFDIFMSKAMIKEENFNFQGGIAVDLTFNEDLVHDTLIDIVREIIAGLVEDQRIDHFTKKGWECSIKEGRERYQGLLQFGRLPPVEHEDSSGRPTPVAVRSVPRLHVPSMESGEVGDIPGTSPTRYSVMYGGQQIHSAGSLSAGSVCDGWDRMTDTGAAKLITATQEMSSDYMHSPGPIGEAPKASIRGTSKIPVASGSKRPFHGETEESSTKKPQKRRER